jgi:hypothetical protein
MFTELLQKPSLTSSRHRIYKYSSSTLKDRSLVLCLAHVTNTMAQSEGDFEKANPVGAWMLSRFWALPSRHFARRHRISAASRRGVRRLKLRRSSNILRRSAKSCNLHRIANE